MSSKNHSQSEWEEANFFMKWTFSVANPMINKGIKGPHQTIDDLMLLPSADFSEKLVEELIYQYNLPRKFFYFLPKLVYSLIKAHWSDWILVHILAACEGCTRIASPVIIMYLLQSLAEQGPTGRANSFKYAGVLGILNLIQTGIHHILFFITMRMGWRWKTATTGFIFASLFQLKGMNVTGTGKLVNLISNDVSKFEEFAVMAPFAIMGLLEMIAIFIILIFELNLAAAFAGIGITVLFIPIQIYIAKQFARRRTDTAHQTDLRVRYTSELIDGIATVKSYSWENPFFSLLSELRKKEMHCIQQSQTLRSVNQGLFYCVPWVAAFSTFSVYWASGGYLTLPIVFSTLALLQQLRLSIGRQWTRAIETGSEAVASAIRIENFLTLTAADNVAAAAAVAATISDIAIDGDGDGSSSAMNSSNRLKSLSVSDEAEAGPEDADSVIFGDKSRTTSRPEYISRGECVVLKKLISIPRSSYYYNDPSSPVLVDIELTLRSGELIIIAGPVGAGKSSLLSVILGEMKRCHCSNDKKEISDKEDLQEGNSKSLLLSSPSSSAPLSSSRPLSPPPPSSLCSRIAYCAQRPWIVAASVQTNITIADKSLCNTGDSKSFSEEEIVEPRCKIRSSMDPSLSISIDEDLYALAIESTQVVADLLNWPNYDDTEIGEKGISISGGQKARIALARAVYSDADVMLLDDPLSAVDSRVGSQLFFGCLLGAMRDRGKGVILATHQLQYMQHADRILALDRNGRQIFYGTYAELQEREDIFAILTASIGESGSGDAESAVGMDDRFDQVESKSKTCGYEDVIPAPSLSEMVIGTETETGVCSSTPLSHIVLSDSQSAPPSLISNPSVVISRRLEMNRGNHEVRGEEKEDTCTLCPLETLDLNQIYVPQKSFERSKNSSPYFPGPRFDPTLSSINKKGMNESKIESKQNGGSISPEESADIKGKKNDRHVFATLKNLFYRSQKDKDKADDKEVIGSESHDNLSKSVSQIIVAEDRVEGRLSCRIWIQYMQAGGTFRGLYAISVAVIAQVLLMITEYWVRWWAGGTFFPERNAENIWILGILTFLCIIIGFYRAIIWFQFTLAAASTIHERSLWAVIHTPLQFFVANPSGRILNRFTKDQSQADEALPVTLFDSLQSVLYCVSVLLLICVSIPYLIILMPFLIYIFDFVRNKYLLNSIEIKRLEAISRSPIYVDFSSALEGLVTLRGYRLEKTAIKSFQGQLDRNTRAWFSFLMVSRWLGFRLDVESSIVLICVVFVAVSLRDSVDVGLLGFTIVYALSLSGLLQWTVRQMAEVETQMTSVERISAYSELLPESGYSTTLESYQTSMSACDDDNDDSHSLVKKSDRMKVKALSLQETKAEAVIRAGALNRRMQEVVVVHEDELSEQIESGFNSNMKNKAKACVKEDLNGSSLGSLQIRNISVKYSEEFVIPVLKSLSLNIPGGSKVGVIGRTGCGKSSLLLALLRLNCIVDGDILIDGESILEMDLERSRGMFSVIPQDPHLFSGTIRFNLDPFGAYSDRAIWSALESAHIKECVEGDVLGLDKIVGEGGLNFSVGQRQLLSLSRAILRKSNIVLMDEVTASIDYTTDRLIQKTIRTSTSLRDCTIISVAHRLRTVADSDIVVVMETGGVIGEVGTPLDLINNPKSLFYSFAKETNEFDEIFNIASNANKKDVEIASL